MAKRKRTAFQKCVGAHLKGKKGGRAAFKKAVKACKGKGAKKSRRHRRKR